MIHLSDEQLKTQVRIQVEDIAMGKERLAQLHAEQCRRLEAKQAACKHPDGFPGAFMFGVCPHCGLDNL